MSLGTIALIIAGLLGFALGAYFAANVARELGVVFMGIGLVMQALALRQLRIARLNESQPEAGDER